jgi:hypothetical protein
MAAVIQLDQTLKPAACPPAKPSQPHSRVSNTGRSRAHDPGHPSGRKARGLPRRPADHDGLSPRSACIGANRAALGPSGSQGGHSSRRPTEEWVAFYSSHPLRRPELRALRAWRREQGDAMPYIFTSLRGAPMTRRTVHHVVAEAGKAAGIDFQVHPHMLRHATGYFLANAGQDTRAIQLYLGHRNIQHTVRYTELAPGRFKDFWQD